MDDHQMAFELQVMINMEKIRPLEDDVRDVYYQASTIKKLTEIKTRFEELSRADSDARLAKRIKNTNRTCG